MDKRVVFLVAITLSLCQSADGATRLLHRPSYSNGRIVFSYQGDIWVANEDGGEISRLSDDPANDDFPMFSPDGKWVAFSSNRFGNLDVFVVPSGGGTPRRLTFHSADDTVIGWTPDGKRIMFLSARWLEYPHRWGQLMTLFEVPLEGGLEQPVDGDRCSWASYSPDGKRLALNRNHMQWWRKHYRGTFANDLWVMDVAGRSFTKLGGEEYKGNYAWPMYGNRGEIYFIADPLPNETSIVAGSPEVMRSRNNLWKITDRGGAPVQVTRHTSGTVYFPSISADRRVIVYEADFGIWKLDTTTGTTKEVKVSISGNFREPVIRSLVLKSEAEAFDLSPSGKRAVIAAHGEIFTVGTDGGGVSRITNSPSRETQPQWSPDGNWLAFVSDRSGRTEVWVTGDNGNTLKKLTDTDTEKRGLRWAPDSKALVYAGTDHNLYTVSITGKNRVVVTSDTGDILNPQFSPDGKWIVYGRQDRNSYLHVYVISSTGGEEHAVGRRPYLMETVGRWTPDGTKLVFLAGGLGGGSRKNPLQLCTADLYEEGSAGSIDWGGLNSRISTLR